MVFTSSHRRTIVKSMTSLPYKMKSLATEALQPKLLEGNGQPVASASHNTNPEAYQLT